MNLLIGALLALIISVISSQKIEKHEIKNFIMNWVLFSIFLIYMLILLSFFSIENEWLQKTFIVIILSPFFVIILSVKDFLFKIIEKSEEEEKRR